MNDEFDAPVRNGTWELIPSTSMQNLVGLPTPILFSATLTSWHKDFQSRILASCPTFSALRFLPLHLVCCLLKGATSLIFLSGKKCLVQNLLLHHLLGWQQRRLYLYECLYCLSWSSSNFLVIQETTTDYLFHSHELGVTLPTPFVIYCTPILF
ncbi:hypothetical protein AAG906_025785 [Vitis piasezkii]